MPLSNSGQSSKLRAALGLSNEKAAYDIFSSSMRQLCLSKLNVNIQGVDIPLETLGSIFKEAKHQYPVLLADVDDPDSVVRSALKDYILLQHKLLRGCASKLRERTSFRPPDSTVHSGPTQSPVSVSNIKRKNDKVDSPSKSTSSSKRTRPEFPDDHTSFFPLVSSPEGPGLGGSFIAGGRLIAVVPPPSYEGQQYRASNWQGEDPTSGPVKRPNRGGPPLSSAERSHARHKQKKNSDVEGHDKRLLKPKRLGTIDLSAIEDFLQAAKPPLGELLPHFLDAGLHTEEDLRALAQWEEKDIVDFFLTSFRQFDTQVLTTWDIYRLTKHLKGYFSDHRYTPPLSFSSMPRAE